MYNYIGILLEGRERFEEESLIDLRQNQSCEGTTLAGTSSSNIQFPYLLNLSHATA